MAKRASGARSWCRLRRRGVVAQPSPKRGTILVVLLFLDIDGVLRRENAPRYRLEPALLEAFENAMRWIPDAELVISSSWREGFSLGELRGFFPAELRARIIGTTPIAQTQDGHVRHREVLAFLAAHELQNRPWIAIDDDREHYPPGCEVLLIDRSVGFDREAGKQLVLMTLRLEATAGSS
jgi:hypothetical protein